MLLSHSALGMGDNNILARPRLLDAIDGPALAPVTLILAPAGFGKSTLAAQWAEHTVDDVVWVSVSPEHNNLDRFLAQLVSGLTSGAETGTGESTQAMLERLASRAGTSSLTIVLDDVHHLTNNDVDRSLTTLLTARIPNVRWLLLARSRPTLPISRLRVEGRLREIGMDSLAFSDAETADMIQMMLGKAAREADTERLMEFTGGWITGIRLTLLADGMVRAGHDRDVEVGTTAVEWIDSYLAEEVIDRLPDGPREFLLRTSGLPYLSSGFVSHVADISEEEGKRYLALMARHFLLRKRITESGTRAGYVDWIAGSLSRMAKQRFSRDEQIMLSKRVAGYLLENDSFEMALGVARRSDDHALMADIVRKLHSSLALEDRTVKIRELIEILPRSVILQHPDLAYSYAFSLHSRGDTAAMVSIVSEVLPRWRTSSDPVVRGYAMNCKGLMLVRSGNAAKALRHFEDALSLFPTTHYRERLHALAGVLSVASMIGEDDLVDQAAREARICVSFLPHHQVIWWMEIQPTLANHYAFRGAVSLAGELYENISRNLPPTFANPLPYFEYLTAAPMFEANDLKGAAELISGGLDAIASRPHDHWHADGYALGARIARARGEHELAEERLSRARSAATFFNNRHSLMQIDTIKASWSIAEGDLLAARVWEGYWHPNDFPWIQSFGQVSPIATLAQFRIAEQRFDEAIALCDKALTEGAQLKRQLESITIMMWSAIAHRMVGDEDKALAMLRRALDARNDDAIVRAFCTPGHGLDSWRDAALSPAHRAILDHLAGQLTAQPDIASVASSAPSPASPLTMREHEVIKLLADSLSNQQISERMFITERTVKKHVSNILRKLGVRNRVAIAAYALERGWIDG